MADEQLQAQIGEALLAGQVEGAEPVRAQIVTHLSRVFIGEDRVYKMKRAVRLPFVDFTDLEARRRACLAEVEVNRGFGNPLYIGVVSIQRDEAGRFSLAEEGEDIEYLVAMRPFDRDRQLDRIAARGELPADLCIRLARRIAAMHDSSKTSHDLGHATDYRQIIEGLSATEADGAARLGLNMGERSPWSQLQHEVLRLGPLIEERRRAGKVRRVHGDLHLRNICLLDDAPEPFDAIEFDERLATSDVLYDLAFLLMDLVQAGRPVSANGVFNAYWDASGEDEAAVALLPFFMALRAAVRMAIAVEAGDLVEADRYRCLSIRLLQPASPIALAIGGLSGTGKSTVARLLAPHLPGAAGARILRSDVVRLRLQGEGERYSRHGRTEIYRHLAAEMARAAHAGASVIVDATFALEGADALFAAAAPGLQWLWLTAPLETRLDRVSGRRGDESEADTTVALNQREPALDPRWRRIDASGAAEAAADHIAALLHLPEPGAA